MGDASGPRLYHAHVARNRQPILDVLARVLPPAGLVLEIASGSGEHAVFFAENLSSLRWQPTDADDGALASIAAHRAAAGLPYLLRPLRLDVAAEHWPIDSADALVCNNMVHITPWRIAEGLMAGAGRALRAGGIVYLYGPYRIDGRHTAASNKDFDAWLKAQNPEWGIRDLAEVTALARRSGLQLTETVAMPANNVSVIFRRD
jgi:SAM-dependent methyltransferase